MPDDMISDVSIAALVKTLDGAALRHRALANNIANAETPGFTRSDVAFHARLRSAIERARWPNSPRTPWSTSRQFTPSPSSSPAASR